MQIVTLPIHLLIVKVICESSDSYKPKSRIHKYRAEIRVIREGNVIADAQLIIGVSKSNIASHYARGSFIPDLINHQLTVQSNARKTHRSCYYLATVVQSMVHHSIKLTCIIHQQTTMLIRSRLSKIAIWEMAIHPNRPIAKKIKD